MTNQQAPEIYTLHTVPNKGERPWSGIYTVRADAEHDAKVMREVTGRDWAVVRLVVADTAAIPTGPITRYEVVDCIDSKHVPAVIPNGAGPWVRYEDHIAAMVEAQLPAKAEQQPFGWIKQSEIDSSKDFGGYWLWRRQYDCDVPVYLAPQPSPTPQADSVLEDAARWQALEACVIEINGGKDWMSIFLKDDAKPEHFLKGLLADKLAALAARKQGGA